MQIYQDTASILAAASTHPDTQLRHLLTLRIESLVEFNDIDLADLLQVLVLESGDSVADMFGHLGLCPDHLALSYPDPALPDFCPAWEVIEAHGRWFELTFVLRDDGSGVVVFVPDTADAELIEMCRRYALPAANP